jgi:hypothetical protein
VNKLQAKPWNGRKLTLAYRRFEYQGVPRRIRRASQAQYARAMKQAERNAPRSLLARAILSNWLQAEMDSVVPN